MEAGQNTSIVALQVVRGDEQGTVPGGITGPPCSWRKYRDLILQVGES
jgi:hypothetical protein